MNESSKEPGTVDLVKMGNGHVWHIVKRDGYGVYCGRNGGAGALERGIDSRVHAHAGAGVCADCRRLREDDPAPTHISTDEEEHDMATTSTSSRKARGEGRIATLPAGSVEQQIYTLGNRISGTRTRIKRETDGAKKATLETTLQSLIDERAKLRDQAKTARTSGAAAPTSEGQAPAPTEGSEAASGPDTAAPAATEAKPDPKKTAAKKATTRGRGSRAKAGATK